MEKMNETKALAVVPRSLTEVQSFAEMLSKSALIPDALKGKAADVAVQILAGQELGLTPMASIRGVHIVQGKPLLAADTMVALVLGSGLAEYFSCVEETATQVTYETKRKGSPVPQRITWSDQDTKDAGLASKDNWRLHKKQMRRARAKAILARDVYPDVLAGCYDPDEIAVPLSPRERAREPEPEAIDAEFTESPVDPEPSEFTAMDTVETEEALKAMAPAIKALPSKWTDAARKRYGANLERVRAAAKAAG